jgi:hypothetical protein
LAVPGFVSEEWRTKHFGGIFSRGPRSLRGQGKLVTDRLFWRVSKVGEGLAGDDEFFDNIDEQIILRGEKMDQGSNRGTVLRKGTGEKSDSTATTAMGKEGIRLAICWNEEKPHTSDSFPGSHLIG